MVDPDCCPLKVQYQSSGTLKMSRVARIFKEQETVPSYRVWQPFCLTIRHRWSWYGASKVMPSLMQHCEEGLGFPTNLVRHQEIPEVCLTGRFVTNNKAIKVISMCSYGQVQDRYTDSVPRAQGLKISNHDRTTAELQSPTKQLSKCRRSYAPCRIANLPRFLGSSGRQGNLGEAFPSWRSGATKMHLCLHQVLKTSCSWTCLSVTLSRAVSWPQQQQLHMIPNLIAQCWLCCWSYLD